MSGTEMASGIECGAFPEEALHDTSRVPRKILWFSDCVFDNLSSILVQRAMGLAEEFGQCMDISFRMTQVEDELFNFQ